MAAASPIILNSSSPTSYQLPPATPPSVQPTSRILISSSPGLVSPSQFVKPRASGLKSGSRAQQVPNGMQLGFASAGSLWKAKELEQERQRNDVGLHQSVREERQVDTVKPSRGKLAKPKKANAKLVAVEPVPGSGLDEYAYVSADVSKPKRPKKRTVSKASKKPEVSDPKLEVPLDKYAYLDTDASKQKGPSNFSLSKTTKNGADGSNRTHKVARKPKIQPPVPEQQPSEGDANADPDVSKPKQSEEKSGVTTREEVTEDLAPARDLVQSGTINLSEFALSTSAQQTGLKNTMADALPKQKKPRKNARKPDEIQAKAPVKKPRKRIMKSESIILNSDNVEPINEPTSASNYFRPPQYHDTEPQHAHSTPPAHCVHLNDEKAGIHELESPRVDCDHVDQQYLWKKELPSMAVTEQSNYFLVPAVDSMSKEEPLSARAPTVDNILTESLESVKSPAAPLQIPSKRRNWTPVKDSAPIDHEQQRLLTADSANSEPKRQLADILGSFGYVSDETSTHTVERSATGEAVTKRIRIGLVAPIVLDVGTRNEEIGAVQSLARPVKQKKGRKKPQTITAVATAAFQPTKDRGTDDGTISHFFSPSKDCANSQLASPKQPEAKVTKPRKPRKPRKPKESSNEKTTEKSAKPKKPTKAKQAKVKFNESDYRSELFSPCRATAQLQGQNLLFGTSSQLALDEPASFIRNMQNAIRQSEPDAESQIDRAPAFSQASFSQSQRSPQGKSCIRVPTAPHGTYLSIEQARRELWCVSARDAEGAILKTGDAVFSRHENAADVEMEPDNIPSAHSVQGTIVHEGRIDDPELEVVLNRIVVDLCDTSPLTGPQGAPTSGASVEMNINQEQSAEDGRIDPVVPDANDLDDWMLLESSSPLPQMPPREVNVKQYGNVCVARGSGDPINLSPRRFRSPLIPLNPNAMTLNHWSPGKEPFTSGQLRPLSSSVANLARQPRSSSLSGRGRGRPRKDATIDVSSLSPTKRRGRPPKLTTIASEPVEAAAWIDIDDICESDSPTTPSPPRRRAMTSPLAVQPLRLGPSIQASAPTVAVPTLKSKDMTWESIRTNLFERITSVVKSAPSSNEGNKPSWYEKILLYDPIVLEDITAWLNEQGLRVEVRKHKPKAKKRGRKRKDAEPEVEEVEWEVHDEPLQTWMVQKWCEEKSICCLWREGLRGGVRTRY